MRRRGPESPRPRHVESERVTFAVWVGDMVWKSQNLKVASGSKNNATFMVAGTDNVNPAKLSTDWQEANPNLL